MTSRRDFIHSSAFALLGAACAGAPRVVTSAKAGRLPLGFSTLGCPQWSWSQILDFATRHGFPALELRGLQDKIDITQHPELAPSRRADVKRQLDDRGLSVVCLGASARMHETDAATRAAQLDEAQRYIGLAHALGTPYVRVFGDRYVNGEPREATRERIAKTMRELGERARDEGVTLIIESHGDFTDSPSLLEILQRADSPAVALLWDAHHTFVAAHEAPDDTVRQLGRWIRHTHLKDSIAVGTERRYVLTGTGGVPIRRQIEALANAGYRGSYSFEWEKRWHPEIEEPELAIRQYAEVAGQYLRGAGIAESR
ncbi:MAG TPA: sugar phosphate isomerase/epimerase family protein [Gemmatimonadaceae bacterium]|nr:sugar phosphate isomerase/epimerase family protein [Gemmatimonadaceae bacterium]